MLSDPRLLFDLYRHNWHPSQGGNEAWTRQRAHKVYPDLDTHIRETIISLTKEEATPKPSLDLK